MRRVTVKTGLIVSDEQYDRAVLDLKKTAPHVQPPTWDEFINPTKWFLVPNPHCEGYKAELVLVRTADETIKINRWMGPDLRAGDTPLPHNHPWYRMDAHILSGSYTDTHFHRQYDKGAVVGVETNVLTHNAGGTNLVLKDGFHEVIDVDPDTLSIIYCGPGVKNDWGYIDPETGVYTHNQSLNDPHFMDMARYLNPDLRK
jgi:hypothetical protein